jgi:hypothetical protein
VSQAIQAQAIAFNQLFALTWHERDDNRHRTNMLTIDQKLKFRRDGYLVLPGAVAQAQVTAARRVINHSLGEEGMNKDDLPTMRVQTYSPEIRDSAVISDLANRSAVVSAVESLVGVGNLQVPLSGQIALRFPMAPVQITGKRGDLVITHHQLVHTAAPNASSEVRYAAIFRLRHKDVEQVGLDAYTDIWREWEGISALQEATG